MDWNMVTFWLPPIGVCLILYGLWGEVLRRQKVKPKPADLMQRELDIMGHVPAELTCIDVMGWQLTHERGMAPYTETTTLSDTVENRQVTLVQWGRQADGEVVREPDWIPLKIRRVLPRFMKLKPKRQMDLLMLHMKAGSEDEGRG